MSANEKLTEGYEIKTCTGEQDDEIDLLELLTVIWKHRKFIIRFVAVVTFLTIIGSLFMTNIYESSVVIVPADSRSNNLGGGLAATVMNQMGGLSNIIGTPDSASATELSLLLRSNVLRTKIIQNYNLLPILFPDQWDMEKKNWKKEGISLNPLKYISRLITMIKPDDKNKAQNEPGVPTLYDGLRLLNEIIIIDEKEGKGLFAKGTAIELSAQHEDPVVARNLANYFIIMLNDHMSNEAKRVAALNKKYLQEQLSLNSDPLIQQKIYALIAQQVETAMMAEVKENFSFKVIDPPIVPDRKTRPKRAQMVILSFIISLFLAVIIAFILEYLEKKNIKINLNMKFLRKK